MFTNNTWNNSNTNQTSFISNTPSFPDITPNIDNINTYVSTIATLIQNQNDKSLSQLLSFRQLSKPAILSNASHQNLSQLCQNTLSAHKPWNSIIQRYLQSLICSLNHKPKQAWDSCLNALKIIQSKLINNNSNSNSVMNIWYLSVLNIIFKNVTECAIQWHSLSKKEDTDTDTHNDIITATVGQYFQIIRTMASDTNNVNHGLFFTVNQIIKLCDIINNETMANNALSVVERFRNKLTMFPLSDVVTHLYFMGRYHLKRGGIHIYTAQKDLKYAHNLCLEGSVNKIRILILLIPIQIMNGYLPNMDRMALCVKERFFPIIKAIKSGNVLLFKKCLKYYENDFINCGIYLLMAKLEILVFRSLIHKIYKMKQKMNGTKPHIINLSEIKRGIQIQNKGYYSGEFVKVFESESKENNNAGMDIDEMLLNEIDNDEIECILSTLIYKKLIGGYVAHNTACCLSKMIDKAFPPIKNCKDWWISDF